MATRRGLEPLRGEGSHFQIERPGRAVVVLGWFYDFGVSLQLLFQSAHVSQMCAGATSEGVHVTRGSLFALPVSMSPKERVQQQSAHERK